MLNDALRPMLSRWHPRLSAWEEKGNPESEWELAELCREDLETTQKKVLGYVYGLAQILKIQHLNEIVPLLPDIPQDNEEHQRKTGSDDLKWKEIKEISEKEAALYGRLDDDHRSAGWRIFVELASRIATQPIEPDSGSIREALDSLYQLYDLIRCELKQLRPPERNKHSGGSVEKIGLAILNGGLRAFLAKWHPLLSKWEEAKKSEAEWDRAADCRSELAELRQTLRSEAGALGELINIKVEDYLG